MEILILLIGAICWYVVASSSKDHRIFADGLSVAGVQQRKAAALSFAATGSKALRFEREPTNAYDSNAIKVIGVSGATEYFIGYLPKETAAQIVGTGVFESVKARLFEIFIGRTQFVDITIQVLGPKTEKARFDDYLRQLPPSTYQADYLKFFGLLSPKGITTAEAERLISHHQEGCTDEQKAEWRSYASIVEQFDDPDFRDDFELEKVSREALSKAIAELKKEGKNHRYIDDNIDELVDVILDSKPEEAMAA